VVEPRTPGKVHRRRSRFRSDLHPSAAAPMTLCPFEDTAVWHLAPLALTRAAGDLRVGARLLLDTQRAAFPEAGRLVLHTRPPAAGVTAQEHPEAEVNAPLAGPTLFVNQRWRVTPGPLLDAVRAAAQPGRSPLAFVCGEAFLAAWHPDPPSDLLAREALDLEAFGGIPVEEAEGAVLVGRLWHLVEDLPARIAEDLNALGALGQHDGADVHAGALLVHPDRIHLAPGATVRPGAVLNAEDGPIRLEAGAVVEENAVVRGPCWLGPKSAVKMAGRVDGSAVGPQSKVGGEVHESVVHSFSNKAHDGYLGNSYLGRWCNLGADTNTSNLKNDYGEVSLFDAVEQAFVATGRQFLGLVMGDHSKCSINTMFNTGTVVGVFCNLFGSGFPPRHVPSFAWGGAEGLEPYRLDKALRVAEAVLARRSLPLTEADRALLAAVFERTAAERERLAAG